MTDPPEIRAFEKSCCTEAFRLVWADQNNKREIKITIKKMMILAKMIGLNHVSFLQKKNMTKKKTRQ